MLDNLFDRVKTLIGENALNKLKSSSVAVFGVGGVGGYVIEALVRSGVGKIAIFDNDVVSESNINRQIIANVDNIGKDKVAEAKNRILSINPNVKVETFKVFYLPENAKEYDLSGYDYVVDAVDTVSAKIEIISRAKELGVPVISCMGTGGKIDTTALKVADISKTHTCPLARVMRRELNKRNITNVKVVFSTEENLNLNNDEQNQKVINEQTNKSVPPSMIFVPASAGLLIAKEVVLDLIAEK